MKLSEIPIRDPFILPVPENHLYWLFGTTDKNVWSGPGTGFDCYRSHDLQHWDGPIPAFRPGPSFWATTQFWAPEVHRWRDRFFMFATFNADGMCRGTQILASDRPEGPFELWSQGPVTPPDWHCLDGTLHADQSGHPWIVFCHEWAQVHNGAMYALRLASDLKQAVGQPVFLFNAAEAPWVRPLNVSNNQEVAGAEPGAIGSKGEDSPLLYVTDGPFLRRASGGSLLMLWSSFGTAGYAIGLAHSNSGDVQGPWTQEAEPLWAGNGGHGMIFESFDGRRFLTFHQPNVTPNERAVIRQVIEDRNSIYLSED
jgi:arabinan endo-1,5-alpha-L-arabinosidase